MKQSHEKYTALSVNETCVRKERAEREYDIAITLPLAEYNLPRETVAHLYKSIEMKEARHEVYRK